MNEELPDILKDLSPQSPIMGPGYSNHDFAPVLLDKKTLSEFGVVDDDTLTAYLEAQRNKTKATWLTGGYLEERALYQSPLFTTGDEPVRDVHLGLDIWGDAGSAICCPYDGTIHSFAYNDNPLDYGYTLILVHEFLGIEFHTLYGHLSGKYWNQWQKGKAVAAGTIIAELGEKHENGGWVPHLHFQVILDMEGKMGDYPGVCSKEDVAYYRKNCPDPEVLIKKAPSS